MPENKNLPKGFKLGEYNISKKISTGGFSIVYLAYHKDGRPVAVKEFFPKSLHLRAKGFKIEFINMREKSIFQRNLETFKYEAELVMKLKHDNVIEIIDYFMLNGTAYIVMPYEHGMGLNSYAKQFRGEMTEQDIAFMMSGILSAVNMFHEHNIVHLDLKPGNIWIRPNKEALILDFGSARFIDDPQKKKEQPTLTPGFAPAEQHREFFEPSRIGIWSDYYALGATIYALIEHSAPPLSTEFILGHQENDLEIKRKGQYSDALLKIVSYLMQPSWDDRKKIDLKQVIEQLRKIKPVKQTPIMTNDFDRLIKNDILDMQEYLKSDHNIIRFQKNK